MYDDPSFYGLVREQACKGQLDTATHPYLEPLDTESWHCVICGDTGVWDVGTNRNAED